MLWGGLALFAVVACADFFAPPLRTVWLSIVPVFTGSEALAAGEADQLRILVKRDSSGTFIVVVDDTVGIDPETGEASADVSVLLLQSPQTFIVRLEAFRSSDGTILYSGVDTIQVEESSSDQQPAAVVIPLVIQPTGAASVVIAPSDTAVQAGQGFPFRATVLASAVILTAVGVQRSLRQDIAQTNLYLSVDFRPEPGEDGAPRPIDVLSEVVTRHATSGDLRRVDARDGALEVTYYLDVADPEVVSALIGDVQRTFPGIGVTFIDQNQLPSI